MATRSRAPFPAPPWDRVIAAIGAAAVVVFVAVAAIAAVPPSLENTRSSVSDGASPVRTDAMTLVVPAGWVVSRGLAGVTVRTPDGGLATHLDGGAGDDLRGALRAMLDHDLGPVPTATVGPVRAESLASGLDVTHVDVGGDALYAVVATGPDSLVRVVARVAAGRDLADYRAAIGQLLEGIRP